MNPQEFREFGIASIDFINDYLKDIKDRDVLPSVLPGFLHDLIPKEAPETPEHWKNVLNDLEKIILPGLTHWQSPYFHAYFPTTTSYPSMIAEFIAAGIGVLNFSWLCSPAATELEAIVCDWVAKFINLPEKFLNTNEGAGGGSLHGSASDAILVCVIASREKSYKNIKEKYPKMSKHEILSKFIGYSSDQSNSSIEKAGLLSGIPIRLLEANENFELTGETLEKAIVEDLENGKIPIICIATYGTTGTCAFDNIDEIAPICNKYNIWLHIDAAYAAVGNSLPESQLPYKDEFYLAQSFNYNLPKSMLVNYDCCVLWLENASDVVNNFVVDREYLKHDFENNSTIAPDYRNWQLALGRRFRALKVWMVMRIFGLEEIRNYVRLTYKLAEYFESLLIDDGRFEIIGKRRAGLVCFRVKNDNKLTKKILERLTKRKKLYLIEAARKNITFLRFSIGGNKPTKEDIGVSWKEIQECTNQVFQENFFNNVIKSSIETLNKINESRQGSDSRIQLKNCNETKNDIESTDVLNGIDENSKGSVKFSGLSDKFRNHITLN